MQVYPDAYIDFEIYYGLWVIKIGNKTIGTASTSTGAWQSALIYVKNEKK